jgi:MFS superfamily sulfate permease-like transporter
VLRDILTRNLRAKAIAAAAISQHEGLTTVALAGAWVSLAVLILSVTGLLRWATRNIPVPIVKGIQLGAGLSLIISAGTSLLRPLHWVAPVLDNRLWALLAFLVLIGAQRLPRFPYALYMFVLALILAAIHIADDDHHHYPWFHVWRPHVRIPDWLSHRSLAMAIGQLPLTTLNSIIATNALAADLLHDIPAPSVTALGLSVASMNLSGFLFGVMPMCHGSGGLAAQYRFGARSGASVVILGLFKIVLGLLFGDTLLDLLAHFPYSILGITVVAAGLELAKVGQSLNHGASDLWDSSVQHGHGIVERLERWTVMLVTTAGILAFKNDAVGFFAGVICYAAYRLADRFEEWRAEGHGVARERSPLLDRS